MKLSYQAASALADRLLDDKIVERIWKRDPSTWRAAPGSADERSIQTRLGWLDIGETMPQHLPRLEALRDEIRDEGIDAVYLLGMGGSSLCAEVLRSVFGRAEGYPELTVLDTTDELTLTNAAARLTPERTLFIVSSKSGTTLETAILMRHFASRAEEALGGSTRAARQLIVTDLSQSDPPGSGTGSVLVPCQPTHSAPSGPSSFFQIGTVSLTRSMILRHAANESARCLDEKSLRATTYLLPRQRESG